MIITPDSRRAWREIIIDQKLRDQYDINGEFWRLEAPENPSLRYVVSQNAIDEVRTVLKDLEQEHARQEYMGNPWTKFTVTGIAGVVALGGTLLLGAPEAAIALALAAGGYGVHAFPDEEQRGRISPRMNHLTSRMEDFLRNGSLFLLPENLRVTKTNDKRSAKAVTKLREYITLRESIAASPEASETTHEEAQRVKVKLQFLRDEIDDLLNGEERKKDTPDKKKPRGAYRRRSFMSKIFGKYTQ